MAGNKKRKNKVTKTSNRTRSYAHPSHSVSSPPSITPTTFDEPLPISIPHIDRPIFTSSSNASASASSRNIQKLFIMPRELEFMNNHAAVTILKEELLKKYTEPWLSWNEIPELHRNLIFNEFAKKVEWPESDTYLIRKIFEHKASECLSEKLFHARDKGKKPKWMGDEIWRELQVAWESKKYKKMSATKQKNHASDCGDQRFPPHKGGSISHLEHKDRLEAQLGRIASRSEPLKHTYSSQNSNPNGEDEKGSKSGMPDEVQEGTETVDKLKKGRLYDALSHASFISSSSSRAGSSGVYTQQLLMRIDAQQQEISTMLAENEGLKNELIGIKSKLSFVESKLDQLLSMAPFFTSGLHHMQAPVPPRTNIRPSACIPPTGHSFMPIPGFFPSFPNVSPPARSSSPTNEKSDED